VTHNHTFTPSLFARLQSHAAPFVDTIDDVIGRALDALEAAKGEAIATDSGVTRVFNPAAMPSLTYTTAKKLSLNGAPIIKEVYWNTLMNETIRAVGKQGLSPQLILGMMKVPAKAGEFDGPGYKFIKEAGISVQGQNANRAWQQTYAIADALGFTVEAEWVWQDNEKAHLPKTAGSTKISA
jgi:hypothetical protein